jgi:hypothetical protein
VHPHYYYTPRYYYPEYGFYYSSPRLGIHLGF